MESVLVDDSGLPVIIRPKLNDSLEFVLDWIEKNKEYLDNHLHNKGAVLFRGFKCDTPEHFDMVAQKLEPELKKTYHGTSARSKLTDHVYTSTELPSLFPIPQHCEMAYTRNVSSKVFFACAVAPKEGGETPLCDFRKVYEDLPEDLRRRWEAQELSYLRNYTSPWAKSFDPLKQKKWNDIFLTLDKKEVERQCKIEEYTPIWRENDALTLQNYGPTVITHPITKKKTWFNHAHIFHPSVQHAEYKQYLKFLPRNKTFHFIMLLVGHFLVYFKKVFSIKEGTECYFGDGKELPSSDLQVIRDTIWRNTVYRRWEKGDVIVIDNLAVSHGRLPFQGPRQILIVMSEH